MQYGELGTFNVSFILNSKLSLSLTSDVITDVMRKRKHQSAIQFATPLEIDTNAHSRPEVNF